jgi:ERCC4-type nuclease
MSEPKPVAELIPGAIAELRAMVPSLPTVIVDSRERTPLTFANLPSMVGSLQSGDYTIRGAEESFAVERKTVPDLCQSLAGDRDRFLRECHRLRGFRFRRLVVIGHPAEIREAHEKGRCRNPKSVLAGLAVIEARYDIPVTWHRTPDAAALQIERWAFWHHRENLRNVGLNVETPSWALPNVAEV